MIVLVLNGSCGDNGSKPSSGKDPVIEFIKESDYVSVDTTMMINMPFSVGLKITHDKIVKTLKVQVAYNGGARITPTSCRFCDEDINMLETIIIFSNRLGGELGQEIWYFTITDENGRSTEKELKISTTRFPKAIDTRSALLKNQNHSQQVYLGLNGINRIHTYDSKGSSESIDVVYVYDAGQGKHILCAPASKEAELITGQESPTTWKKRNKTKFFLTDLTAAALDTMTNSTLLINELIKGHKYVDHISNLKVGDVVVMQSVADDSPLPSLMLVTDFPSGKNSVDLDVTFEK